MITMKQVKASQKKHNDSVESDLVASLKAKLWHVQT